MLTQIRRLPLTLRVGRGLSSTAGRMDRRHLPQDPMKGPNARVDSSEGSSATATTTTPSPSPSTSTPNSGIGSESAASVCHPAPVLTAKSGASESTGPGSSGPSQSQTQSSPPSSTGPSSTPTPTTPLPPSTIEPAPVSPSSSPPPAHPFDTHAFTSRLEGVNLPSAKQLVESVRALITARSGVARANMLSVSERDNDAYHFKAALSTLRAEQSHRARKDGMTMRAGTAAIRREVDALTQKMKEDIAEMRHDVDMEMDSRKSDTRAEMKRYEIAVQEINNKFTISLSDLRTEIESAKWDATRRAIAIIAILVVSGVVLSTITFSHPQQPPVKPEYVDAGVGEDEWASTGAGGHGHGNGQGQGQGQGQGHPHDTDALDEIIKRLKEEKRV